MKWYQLFNRAEVANLPYVQGTFALQGYGTAEVRLCRGNTLSLVFNGVYLPTSLNGRVPFVTKDGKYGAYLDANGNVWLGVAL